MAVGAGPPPTDRASQIAHATSIRPQSVADAEQVRRCSRSQPDRARVDGGPYVAAAVLPRVHASRSQADARQCSTLRPLARNGADPNAGYLWHGLPTPFTVLTGVFGEGEAGPRRQPRHPHAPLLARLLLEAGADPNDGQALYNRMFGPDNDHLELLFEFGLGTGDGGPWRGPAAAMRWTHRPSSCRASSNGPSFTTCGAGWSCSSSTAPMSTRPS